MKAKIASTWLPALLAAVAFAVPAFGAPPADSPLAALAARAAKIRTPTFSAVEIAAAVRDWKALAAVLAAVDEKRLGADDRIDLRLLREHAAIQLFELDEIKLYQLTPFRYFALDATDDLLLRPCAAGGDAIGGAIAELERLPALLVNAKRNLTRPARIWTENAIYTGWYARKLLAEDLPAACLGQESRRAELLAAAEPALAAVEDFQNFLEQELLPRSDRSPAWKPERRSKNTSWCRNSCRPSWARPAPCWRSPRRRRSSCWAEMQELAKRIHPSGDLHSCGSR